MTKEEIYKYFEEMMLSKSNEKAWHFEVLDFSSMTEEEQIKLYIQLFDERWHNNHENIASYFQTVRNPLATDILYKTALRNDIEEFDYKPLSRKCTWALADIGTEKARKYLEQLATSGDKIVEGFARKRLENWESELGRKGQRWRVARNFDLFIRLENYTNAQQHLPTTGQQIIGNVQGDYIIVYQAYKASIANYSIEHQTLGGNDFSYKRMSWIKPNFLWMMHRCGWAAKENQERVLAFWVHKNDFKEILTNATFTSFNSRYFANEQEWRKELEIKKVRLQWDPDHDPFGSKMERRAIQLGLKDEALEKFGKQQIKYIMDITDFVKEQKLYVDSNEPDKLLLPIERVIDIDDKILETKIGIEKAT